MGYEKVLITGASSGIGEALARACAREGQELFLTARRSARLKKLAEECLALGAPKVLIEEADLSRPGEGGRIVEQCLARLEGLELLICNAGYGIVGPVREVTPQQMARIWQVNYQSQFESIHTALPHLLESRKGYIVLVSSIIGKKAVLFSAAYCATKFAQIALGESLWCELQGTGVGVSVVCPGFTASEFAAAAERTESMRKRNRREGGQSPEKVAEIILRSVQKRKIEVHLTVPGKLLCGLNRLAPQLTTRLAGWYMRRQ